MSGRHRHKYQRLSDAALFCACGEVKYVVEPVCARPHYYPTWIWRDPYTYPTWYPTITTGGTSPFPLETTTITYSLSAGLTA